jgi:hypothetical protein
LVVDGAGLNLYEFEQRTVVAAELPRWAGWVVAVDIAVVAILGCAVGIVAVGSTRGRLRPRHQPSDNRSEDSSLRELEAGSLKQPEREA